MLNNMDKENILSIQQAANLAGLSVPMLKKAIQAGQLQASLLGKHYKIKENEVVRFKTVMKKQTKSALVKMSNFDNELGLD